LGLDEDTELFAYFRRHYAHFFPNLRCVHRTTFSRQAANLWKANGHLWRELLAQTPHDPTFALADSLPLPVCMFARAHRCRRFKGEATFGKDTLLKQTFYGFRVHMRVCWPGIISRFGGVWNTGSCRCRGQRQLRRGAGPLPAHQRCRGLRGEPPEPPAQAPALGKHDTADAEAAARALQVDTATGEPKSADGPAEMVRALHVVRRSAVKARTQAANQLRALLLTAPEALRAELRGLLHGQVGRHRSALPSGRPQGPAGRDQAGDEIARSSSPAALRGDRRIRKADRAVGIRGRARPRCAAGRVGTDTAASLLVAVGDNPERLRSEASFARLCGVAPVPASSGKTVRYLLNRGANTDANRALHALALGRMSWDENVPESTSR